MKSINLSFKDSASIAELFKNFPDGWNETQIKSGFAAGTLRAIGVRCDGKNSVTEPGFLSTKTIDEKKSGLIGVILFSLGVDTADIEDVFVSEEFRKNGVGKLLVFKALSVCKRAGKEKVFLEVRKGNFAAIKLYENSGFNKISERKKYYGDEDAVVMVKEL